MRRKSSRYRTSRSSSSRTPPSWKSARRSCRSPSSCFSLLLFLFFVSLLLFCFFVFLFIRSFPNQSSTKTHPYFSSCLFFFLDATFFGRSPQLRSFPLLPLYFLHLHDPIHWAQKFLLFRGAVVKKKRANTDAHAHIQAQGVLRREEKTNIQICNLNAKWYARKNKENKGAVIPLPGGWRKIHHPRS